VLTRSEFSAGIPPCQGMGREFEPRLPLQPETGEDDSIAEQGVALGCLNTSIPVKWPEGRVTGSSHGPYEVTLTWLVHARRALPSRTRAPAAGSR
jgi:hypothetical protein